LRFDLPAPQPSRRHHAQSLLGPSFHDPRTHHVLESHPERAAPLFRRDDERCHAIGSHSAFALRLYLAAYNTSSSCRFWVLDHLWSNLSQSFQPIQVPFLALWPSRPPAIETLPRPVPAGPLISWPRNASCSRILPRASRASLPPRLWAMSRHRLSLRLCTTPLSCSLQPLLKWTLLSLRPSLLQFAQSFHLCWITEIQSLNLCVCFTFSKSSSVFTFLIEMNFSF